MTSAREEILAKLKAAKDKRGEIVLEKPDFTSPVYLPLDENKADEFRKKIELVGGHFIVSANIAEAVSTLQQLITENNWKDIFCKDERLEQHLTGKIEFSSNDENLKTIQVGITRCEYLIAHLGAVMVSSAHSSGRRLNVFPEIHVIFANESQLTDYMESAMTFMQEKYGTSLPSMISVITGPSRTADIEKTLVLGMHGPKAIYVMLCKETF